MDREKQYNYEEFFMKEFAKQNKEQYLNFYYNAPEQLEIENTEHDSSNFDETGDWWKEPNPNPSETITSIQIGPAPVLTLALFQILHHNYPLVINKDVLMT